MRASQSRVTVFAVALLIAACLAMTAGPAMAGTTALHSVKQITDGTTIDFESAANQDPINAVLAPYGMMESDGGGGGITQLIPSVIGNADAPMNDLAMFGFQTISTSTGWQSVGISLASTLGGPVSQTFTYTAYDQNHDVVSTDTHQFVVSSSNEAAFNSAVFFEGTTSTTPIYSFEVVSSNPNFAGDYLTFVPAPEPNCAWALLALPLLGMRRATRSS